jgi:hypothetical protein
MPTPETTAESFRSLDFHDDTLVDIRVLPAQREEGANSRIEVQLFHYGVRKSRVIRFLECANLRIAMDFDVLANNLPPNTSKVYARTDANRLRELIESQKRDWDITYPKTATSPIAKKSATLDEFVFFRVQFFGGALEVIARGYEVEVVADGSPR